MDRNTATARDKTDDLIWGRRLAAPRQLRHQAIDTHNKDAAARIIGPAAVGLHLLQCARIGDRGIPAQGRLQRTRADLVTPHRREQILRTGEVKAPGQFVQVDAGPALALHFTFNRAATVGDGLLQRLAVEPLPHLMAGTRTAHQSECRVEPVAARPAALGADDLHALSVGKPRIEGHHLAVHTRAATAVSDIGVQRIGKIDRRRPGRQVNHATLRRQNINGVIERSLLGLRHPIGGIDNVIAPGQHLA